ncbi:MAG: trigger factor [Bacillota bacterium]
MVKATVERSEDNENVRILRIEVEPEMVEEHMNRAFREIRGQIQMPGFRRGHVPRKIFENRFGVEPIWEEALENLVPEAYGQAVEDLDINPVAPPEVDFEDGGPGEGFVFTATVEVLPDVKLGEYKDLGLELELPEIEAEDVDQALQDLRERRATAEVVEDEEAEVAPGMLAIVAFQGYLDGEAREELKADEEMLDIGSGNYLPGFEDGLLGAKAGETREVEVEIPSDAPSEDLAGREVTFEVEVKDLKRKVLPELDDEFAKEVSDVDTLEKLREQVAEYLEDARISAALNQFENEVVEQVVENAELEVPEPMIEDLVKRRIEEMKREAESQGAEFEAYLVSRGFSDEASLRKTLLEGAGPDLKESLVLDAIAEVEEIEVSDEEFERGLVERAESMGTDPGVLRQISLTTEYGRRLRSDLRMQKVRHLLAEWTDPRFAEVRKELEEKREERRRRAREKAEAAEAAAEATEDGENEPEGEPVLPDESSQGEGDEPGQPDESGDTL